MATQMIRGTSITRPTPAPLGSSVLDHATVVGNAKFGLRNNEGLWPSYNCLDTIVPTPICPDPLLDETGGSKEFAVAPWIPAFEFAVIGAVQCQAVGLDKADMESELARVFALNEGKGVEEALLLNRFVATTSGDAVQWDAPVDLSVTGMTVPAAIGTLEGYAAATYAGIPTLHMPRALIVVAAGLGLLVERDGKFFTKAGSKIAAGGGYDTDAVPTATRDIFITGEVYVERSETVNMSQYVVPGDGSGTGSGENGLSPNTVIALAERMYRVGIDCLVAKATATVWS